VILALILLIVVAGYLQYSYKQGSDSAALEAGRIGEAVYVDNEIANEGIEEAVQQEANETDIKASKEANDFFAQAKMDREQSRSKATETLRAITEDASASKETIAKAHEEIFALMDTADREMRIETLIGKMGFSDCVVLFADDGSVDVVVKTPSLSTAQVVQITDTVSRQANVAIDNIHIKKLY
jgi:stage III sporulation protein AH